MKSIMSPIPQPGRIYHFHHRDNIVTDSNAHMYHYHTFCEIYLFCGGDAEFIVEGCVYSLEKNDIMIIPPYKFHQPVPKIGTKLERIVLNIFPSFFAEMACDNYNEIISTFTSAGYKINSRLAHKYKLLDSIHDIDKAFKNNYASDNILPNLKIVEFLYKLYLLTKTTELSLQEPEIQINDSIVSDIIKYINEHYHEITDIASVTSVFNYSQNYLNTLFKKNTGITIAKYVNVKRFENVERLFRAGNSLEFASKESGFNNYRHFAYAYKKEYGISPRNGLNFLK